MVVSHAQTWKLVLAGVLVAAILLSVVARAPRRPVPHRHLRRLVVAAVALYGVGLLAYATRHVVLAAMVLATGSIDAALAAWLSRAHDSDDPPDFGEPGDEPEPPEPSTPEFDWDAFERSFRAYSERREPAGSR